MGIFKRLLRKGMKYLPEPMKLSLIRSFIDVSKDPPEAIHFRVARTQSELEQAFGLLHEEYVRAGYMEPHPSGLRVTKYHILPSTAVLVAVVDDEVIGTVSLIKRSDFGMPFDTVFSAAEDIAPGESVAEVSSLAVRRDYQGKRDIVLLPLIKYLVEYCECYFGVDTLVMTCHPDRFAIYQALAGWHPIEQEVVENYGFAKGAPAQGGIANIADTYQELAASFAGKRPEKNMYRYLRHRRFKNFQFPDREFLHANDPVMTYELIDYFFKRRTSLMFEFSDREICILRGMYDHPKFAALFEDLKPLPSEAFRNERKEFRFDVNCPGRTLVKGEVNYPIDVSVISASKNGMMIFTKANLPSGASLQLQVAISSRHKVQMDVISVWDQGQKKHGLQIVQSNEQWESFVEYLGNLLNHETLSPSTVKLTG
jgi:hypothetical protein